ncbi:DUF1311 domain-containing protein [Roseobacter sp. HKCCD9010]|uniref:lysozyme inhibitor LprI family protein n=1 Tax=unclassified Roseobacter TaxID=196798 RepID=UPI0014914B25|nr:MULTISPECIES: lysozyme inhibitor LprI family protein [unclassified Roseobacter]MBF9050006.1 DUF1311 domain-containing protein [Rhodobacterales bacterium HKCCD4356]NNV12249.1 DUF1311 domain-containing protein [Roseobacter sp. HKCCD7357]NNV16288.1 DUF1311 domain-containing protein [Roseobacter sp. HKCCD8768]NNV25748.1 DUF1311 domain-containing protein [Roseobacter sp. HKCCD8192]NNV30004.1 DUF1311 domain-containing protein [Roseobacter sp. HKCCD9061]
MKGLWAVLLLIVPMPAVAQEWDCTDFAALPQQGINACLAEEYARVDAELNAVYQSVLADAQGAMPDLIRTAQRAWIPFRDAACEAEAEFMRGAPAEAALRLSCLIRLTETRTDELGYLDHGE